MANLKEEAQNYEEKFRNITECGKLKTDLDIKDGNGMTKDGKEFQYKYFLDGETEVRVPFTVLKQLKEQLKERPDMEEFKVTKTGSGLTTEYTVIPL